MPQPLMIATDYSGKRKNLSAAVALATSTGYESYRIIPWSENTVLGELEGFLDAVQYAVTSGEPDVIIITDSTSVIHKITHGANGEVGILVERIWALLNGTNQNISYYQINGHSGNDLNDRAHHMANIARKHYAMSKYPHIGA